MQFLFCLVCFSLTYLCALQQTHTFPYILFDSLFSPAMHLHFYSINYYMYINCFYRLDLSAFRLKCVMFFSIFWKSFHCFYYFFNQMNIQKNNSRKKLNEIFFQDMIYCLMEALKVVANCESMPCGLED